MSQTYISHISPGGRSYHETIKSKYVASTNIPEILSRHGLDAEFVLDEERHSLLEQPAPLLCADRTDYGLRDSFIYGFMTAEEIQSFVDQLVNVDGRMVCSSITDAQTFTDAYEKCDIQSYTDIHAVGAYEYTAKIIRDALETRLICEGDLYLKSDVELWTFLEKESKLLVSSDEEQQKQKQRQRLVTLINKNLRFVDVQEREAGETCEANVPVKIRWIDPLVLLPASKTTKHISEISGIKNTRCMTTLVYALKRVNVCVLLF